MPTPHSTPWHRLGPSKLHGQGVFARRNIPAGTEILEYTGERITPEEADEKAGVHSDDPFHTFFFALSSGEVIDGNDNGNDARWINHHCEPNCEAQENETGDRVFVVALRDIQGGEELFFDYGLVIDEPFTEALQEQYRCLCGSSQCRGTMLAPPDPDNDDWETT